LNNDRASDPERFDEEVKTVCDAYAEASQLTDDSGKHIVSTDEKTGIQALERKHPTKPMIKGSVERREHEYKRHGTQALIASMDVSTGMLIGSIGETRTEADFVAHIATVVATDPSAEWVFIVDQLNTHKSESLVRYVAEQCGIEDELGRKGRDGILKSMVTRADFLQDDSHRIYFIYPPKHCSWLNQIEIWFSILSRRLLKRGSFDSKQTLHDKIVAFIDYFNETLAKPFKWTYKGKPLAV